MVPLSSISYKHFCCYIFAELAGGNTLAYWLGVAIMKVTVTNSIAYYSINYSRKMFYITTAIPTPPRYYVSGTFRYLSVALVNKHFYCYVFAELAGGNTLAYRHRAAIIKEKLTVLQY